MDKNAGSVLFNIWSTGRQWKGCLEIKWINHTFYSILINSNIMSFKRFESKAVVKRVFI